MRSLLKSKAIKYLSAIFVISLVIVFLSVLPSNWGLCEFSPEYPDDIIQINGDYECSSPLMTPYEILPGVVIFIVFLATVVSAAISGVALLVTAIVISAKRLLDKK